MNFILKPFTALFALLPALTAGVIDVTDQQLVTLSHGSELAIHFGVWNYGRNNPTFSPYPSSLGLNIVGLRPALSALTTMPGTTVRYADALLFTGALESLDGSFSVPLTNSYAALGGVSSRKITVQEGSISFGEDSPLAALILTAEASFSLETSHRLFGPNIGNYDDGAVLRLRNLGADFTIGMGSSYTVRNSIMVPSVRGAGNTETAGIIGRVSATDVPEPSTWLLLAGGLMLGVAVPVLTRLRMRHHTPQQ